MTDNLTKLITEHDNEHFTLDELIGIAKQMFDDTKYGETKNVRVMWFSIMYAPHIESGYDKKIAQGYEPGSTYGREINKGRNLGMQLRKLVGDMVVPPQTSDLPHTRYYSLFVLRTMKYLESTGELEQIAQFAEMNPAPFYNDGSKTVILKSGSYRVSSILLVATEEQIKQRNSSQRLWYDDCPIKLGKETAYVYTAIRKEIRNKFASFIRDFFDGKYIVEKNAETDEYELHIHSEDNEDVAAIGNFNGNKPEQRIYFGTPGSGKSRKVKDYIEEKNATERSFRTTFHPDSDYASFVGSYKPVMEDDNITYKFIPQVFTNAYVAAWSNPSKMHYLVIEEINRGNCAQIFGDLFQLLDRNDDGFSEYPIEPDADLADYLKEQGIDGKLSLPPNLSILATMNTSDQSLFPMDSAFKRRWEWEYVPSSFNDEDNFDLDFEGKKYKWHDFLEKVNERIKKATDSEDKQLGAYFIKSNMGAKEFKSKVMFYLWNEVCKDEYKTPNNFFRHKVGEKDEEFTFNDLYKETPDDATLLNEFMEYIMR